MSRSWEDLAEDVAEAWARPRGRGCLPSVNVDYMADRAYWQAVNMYGFEGDEEAWRLEVRNCVPIDCPYDPDEPKGGLRISKYVEPGAYITEENNV